MKRIRLTQGKFALVDNEDFFSVSQFKWHLHEKKYARCKNRWGAIYMHRLIASTPPGMDTDHINGNPLDNRRRNLRICSRSENGMNRKKTVGNSRFKGVHWSKRDKTWRAQIQIKGKMIYLGCTNDEKKAARLYNTAAMSLFGKFARLNNVD